MARVKVNLDIAAVGKILREDCRPMVDEAARAIAAAVDMSVTSVDSKVTVRSYTTDRAAAAVSIAHPAGLAIEAKHGVLRRAAASQGLEVKSKP